jgi:hypothetical protein
LADFGRRLSEREDGLGMPASEKLHGSGQSLSALTYLGSRVGSLTAEKLYNPSKTA